MYNNKGGYKCTRGFKEEEEGATPDKCLPFEVLGPWMARLSMWQLGMADLMFTDVGYKDIVWDPRTCKYVGSEMYLSDDEYDSDWTLPITDDGSSSSDASEYSSDSGDIALCRRACTLNTRAYQTVLHTKSSKRRKCQQRPLVLKSSN